MTVLNFLTVVFSTNTSITAIIIAFTWQFFDDASSCCASRRKLTFLHYTVTFQYHWLIARNIDHARIAICNCTFRRFIGAVISTEVEIIARAFHTKIARLGRRNKKLYSLILFRLISKIIVRNFSFQSSF